MDKKKVMTICVVIFVVVFVAVCFAIVQFSKQDLENAQKDLQEALEKYGTVEKEIVNVLVAKLNTEIMDNGINTPASDELMVAQDGLYWYGLTDDVSIYVKPVEFSNDNKKDIAEISAIYMSKDVYDEQIAIKYAKLLIKANNEELTEDEIDTLIKDAKTVSKDNKMSNNGKGISVAIVESDSHFEYQVKRLYK